MHSSLSLPWDARAGRVSARCGWVGWETIGRRTPAVRNQMQFTLPWDDVKNPITQLGRPLNGLIISPLLPGFLPAGCWLKNTSQRPVGRGYSQLIAPRLTISKENRPPVTGSLGHHLFHGPDARLCATRSRPEWLPLTEILRNLPRTRRTNRVVARVVQSEALGNGCLGDRPSGPGENEVGGEQAAGSVTEAWIGLPRCRPTHPSSLSDLAPENCTST